MVDVGPLLQCTSCKAEKVPDQFWRVRRNKSGRHSWCRECASATDRARRARQAQHDPWGALIAEQIAVGVELRPVRDNGNYRVGTDGSVWSICQRRRPRRLKPRTKNNGYYEVQIYANGICRAATIHSLVLEAFAGPRPNGMEGSHGDGDKTNNQLSNLRWATRAENLADLVRHNRQRRAICGPREPLTMAPAQQGTTP